MCFFYISPHFILHSKIDYENYLFIQILCCVYLAWELHNEDDEVLRKWKHFSIRRYETLRNSLDRHIWYLTDRHLSHAGNFPEFKHFIRLFEVCFAIRKVLNLDGSVKSFIFLRISNWFRLLLFFIISSISFYENGCMVNVSKLLSLN